LFLSAGLQLHEHLLLGARMVFADFKSQLLKWLCATLPLPVFGTTLHDTDGCGQKKDHLFYL
jgi:hypothetical protein